MAIPMLNTFYLGLILIVLGTGLLKPNVSAIVGSLYSADDARRDAGFSIFYMGINLGAFLAPFVCSALGEKVAWHWGFGAAGVGMTLGVIQYYFGRDRIAHIGHPPKQTSGERVRKAIIGTIITAAVSLAIIYLYFIGPPVVQNNRLWIIIGCTAIFLIWLFISYLKAEERKPVFVIFLLFLFAVVFWSCFEQAGSSLNLFARDFTDRKILGYEFPAGLFQSVNAIFLIIFAPIMSLLWLKLGDKQPSSPAKFSYGLLFVGLGIVVIAIASTFISGGGKVSPLWLVGVYFCHTIGELSLSPIGLSTTTKLAPARLSGLMMGLWFLSISFGSFIGGEVAGFFPSNPEIAPTGLFAKLAVVPIIASLILVAMTPFIRRLMGKVR